MYKDLVGYGIDLSSITYKVGNKKRFHALLRLAPKAEGEVRSWMRGTVNEDKEFSSFDPCEIYEALSGENHPNYGVAIILAAVIREKENIPVRAVIDYANTDNIYLVHEFPCYWEEFINQTVNYSDLESKLDRIYSAYVSILTGEPCYAEAIRWTQEVPDDSSSPKKATSEEKCFFVETPVGKIRVKAKDEGGEYPGIYVDLISHNGKETSLACTEYVRSEGVVYTEVFRENNDYSDRMEHKHLADVIMEEAKNHVRQFCKREYGEECEFKDLSEVPLAYTCPDETELLEVQVDADLKDPSITTYIIPKDTREVVCVSVSSFDNLADMIGNFLSCMEFDSLVRLTDNEWENFRKSKPGLAWLNRTFPSGTRIHLEEMVNDPTPVPSGTEGTVLRIDDAGQIEMAWDNGRTLRLLYGKDLFSILPKSEEEKL